jgi:uncharacterized peroxidase-related enzyme
MQAHAADLRAEVQDDAEGAALAQALLHDWRTASLSAADRAMLTFAEKLTRTPDRMTAGDVAELRRAGFGDPAIHDIAQIAALFNYYNRLADGLGIDLEPEMSRPEEDR